MSGLKTSGPVRHGDRFVRYEPASQAIAKAWPLLDEAERAFTVKYYSQRPNAKVAVYRQTEPAPPLTGDIRSSLEANGWDLNRRY